MNNRPAEIKPSRIRRYGLIAIIAWTLLVACSLVVRIRQYQTEAVTLGKMQSLAFFEKDMLYRRWASRHGGVYVPVTDTTQPNPYLSHIPERDITTPSGRPLTLMNPAYMTRQVFEMTQEYTGSGRGHITSLKPLRAQNAPDPWEREALKAFERGAIDFGELTVIDGKPYYRYIKSLIAEKTCLKCHETQGYREGEVRGGLSVSVAMEPFYLLMNDSVRQTYISHAIVWLLVTGFAVLGSRRLATSDSHIREQADILRLEKERTEQYLNIAQVIMVAFDDQARITLINKKGHEVLGYAEGELDGKDWFRTCLPPEEYDPVSAVYRQLMAGEVKPVEYYENYVLTKNGEKRLIAWRNTLMEDEAGRFTGILSSGEDITERKVVEEKLRRNEFNQRNLLRNLPVAVVTHAADTSITYCNPESERLLGLSEDKMKGKTAPDPAWHFLREDGSRLPLDEYPVNKIRATRRPLSEYIVGINRPATHDIAWVLVNAFPEMDEQGELLQIIVTCVDVTEGRQAAFRIEQSEAKFSKVFENAPLMMSVSKVDDGTYLDVNRMFCALSGFSREKVIGRTSIEIGLITVNDRQRLLDELRRHGRASGIELELHTENGKPLLVNYYGELIAIDSEQHLLSIGQNVTEQRHLEAQLRQSQKMEAIGLLAGGVAHDFNNILTVIMGYATLLGMGATLDPDQRGTVEQIVASSERAAQLTRGLLAFSRKQALATCNTNLNDVIRHVGKFLVRIIGEDIQLKSICNGTNIPVCIDSAQIEQVLINLAANARDAMPKGGTLTLETGIQEMDAACAYASVKPGCYACITLSDTGCGMDEETCGRIFEPFFTTKEVGKGTGLGMAIVFGIIKQHNGFINVYSEPGVGTTFRIYLPLVEGELLDQAGKKVQAVPQGGNETILLAEDDASVRKLVTTILAQFGYEVIQSVDGQDAVEKFAANGDRVDLLLMDMIMPKKNGKEAYEEICQIKPGMKVLFSSGYTADFIMNRGVDKEGIELIMKPVRPTELLHKVREMLDSNG